MKLGFFVTSQYEADEPMGRKIEENLEQVRAARDAGFDLVSAGQHYLSTPYQMPTLFPILARISAEAGEMQVASGIVLLTLHNPVEIAHSVATMDALCNGRFIFGIGLGYREEEYAAFGVPRRERVPRLLEALEVMKLLWTGDEVEYEGKFYHVPRTRSTCHTTQKPYPPIWLAANNDSAVQRAARLGYPWMINPHATVTTIERQADLYKQVFTEAGTTSPVDLPMMRELYIAEDREVAMYESRAYLASKYGAYVDWGQDRALPSDETFSVPYEELARDRFLIGTPDDVVREIRRYEERLGINYMICRLQWPGLEHEKVMKQLELIGRHVIPRLRD